MIKRTLLKWRIPSIRNHNIPSGDVIFQLCCSYHLPMKSQEHLIFPQRLQMGPFKISRILQQAHTNFTHGWMHINWVCEKHYQRYSIFKLKIPRKRFYSTQSITLVKGNWQFYKCLIWNSLLVKPSSRKKEAHFPFTSSQIHLFQLCQITGSKCVCSASLFVFPKREKLMVKWV